MVHQHSEQRIPFALVRFRRVALDVQRDWKLHMLADLPMPESTEALDVQHQHTRGGVHAQRFFRGASAAALLALIRIGSGQRLGRHETAHTQVY